MRFLNLSKFHGRDFITSQAIRQVCEMFKKVEDPGLEGAQNRDSEHSL